MNTTMRDNESILENNIPYEATSIGDLLKMARARRDISLKDIAKKTKIHLGILNQLENNNLSNLPSKPYVKGFIKTLALLLEINQAKALVLLEEAYDHLIFENLDQVIVPSITSQESMLMKNLSVLKNQRGNLEKIPIVKLSIFALVAGITAMGFISYFNSAIKNINELAAIKSPLTEIKTIVISTSETEGPSLSIDGIASAQLEVGAAVRPLTTSLVFPKYLETRNSEGILQPSNRF